MHFSGSFTCLYYTQGMAYFDYGVSGFYLCFFPFSFCCESQNLHQLLVCDLRSLFGYVSTWMKRTCYVC